MDDIKKICCSVKEALSEFQWEFDGRFNAILTVIDSKNIDRIEELFSKLYTNHYDYKTIKKSSKFEKKLSKQLFGLSKNQLLYTYGNDNDELLFCAWWPWSDMTKVSVRIGIYPLNSKKIDENKISELKKWFGIYNS